MFVEIGVGKFCSYFMIIVVLIDVIWVGFKDVIWDNFKDNFYDWVN